MKNKANRWFLDYLSDRQRIQLLSDPALSYEALRAHDCYLWFKAIDTEPDSTEHNEMYVKLCDQVKRMVSEHPELAYSRDSNGRAAMDVASKTIKEVMQSVLLWQGRYRVTELRPEHMSATCFVFKVNPSSLYLLVVTCVLLETCTTTIHTSSLATSH